MRTKEDRGKGVEEDVVPPLFPETILVLKWYGTDKNMGAIIIGDDE